MHLTETCDEERPNLITNVETTTAAVADDAVTERIHAHWPNGNSCPDKHIADTGFVNSELFVSSRQNLRHRPDRTHPRRQPLAGQSGGWASRPGIS